MWIAAAPVVHTIRSCFVSTTQSRFNASLTQTPNSIATLLSWTSPYAFYAHTILKSTEEKRGSALDMFGSKQSCHELLIQYPFAENNIINEKSHQTKYVPVSSILFAGR